MLALSPTARAASPYGRAWGAGYTWVSDNNLSGGALIYKMDPKMDPADGSIVASFACPENGGSPNGIAHDGENLWIAVNTTDRIYKVEGGIGAAPASPAAAGLGDDARGQGSRPAPSALLGVLGLVCSEWSRHPHGDGDDDLGGAA